MLHQYDVVGASKRRLEAANCGWSTFPVEAMGIVVATTTWCPLSSLRADCQKFISLSGSQTGEVQFALLINDHIVSLVGNVGSSRCATCASPVAILSR